MANKFKRLVRALMGVTGRSYEAMVNHLRAPGHNSAACEVCKLARAGSREDR